MSRQGLRIGLVAAIAALLAAGPGRASADGGKRVVIAERNLIVTFDPATGTGYQTGSFHAAGAISDSGAAEAAFTVTPIHGGRAILKGDHVLTSSVGTIVVRSRVTLTPYPAPRVVAEGAWRIVSATGGYAGLQGHGRTLAVGDFTTATATIMRDGQLGPPAEEP